MADRSTQGTDISFMARLITGVKYAVAGVKPDDWFSPMQPLTPVAQEQAQGRQFDYPVGFNQRIQPRDSEPVSFAQMRALADNYDLLRIVLETVKDQLDTQEWVIKPRDPKAKPDKRSDEVKNFLAFPDQEHDHATWLRMLLEDMLVVDAATLYPRRTKGGQLYALETIDGATIKRVINADGRTPLPPDPAYQQILKGLPAVDYSRDELIYLPRNVRSSRLYGYSPVEQIIMTVNIALRRQLHQLEFYTEGNTPDLIFRVPESWQPDQIKQMQQWWDYLITDTASRRKAKFIPGGVDPYDTKAAALKDEYDEWLARIVCFCFGISPQPFVKEVNRATAQTSAEASKEEGKGPRMLWVKRLHDLIIWKYFGYQDLEFGWEDQTAVDPLVQAQIDQIYLSAYVIGPEEVRARIGLEGPPPEKPAPPVMGGDDGDSGSGSDGNTGAADGGADNPVGDAAKTGQDAKTKIEKLAELPTLTRSKKKAMKPIDRNRETRRDAAEKLTGIVRDFFAEVAPDTISQIVTAYGKISRLSEDEQEAVDKILRDIDFRGWGILAEPMAEVLADMHLDGQLVALAQIGAGIDVATDLMSENAKAYAEAVSAQLVGMTNHGDKHLPEWVVNTRLQSDGQPWAITDSTRLMVRADVATAIEEGWSNDRLAASLQENNAFSDYRAEMIARTETAFADVAGNIKSYRDSGMVAGKEWIVGSEHDDDDECDANADDGVIGLEESFSSGDFAPPSHPHCVCDLLPVLGPDEDQD